MNFEGYYKHDIEEIDEFVENTNDKKDDNESFQDANTNGIDINNVLKRKREKELKEAENKIKALNQSAKNALDAGEDYNSYSMSDSVYIKRENNKAIKKINSLN